MVSIILYSHNNKPHLFRCINSIKNQLYNDWECIVVDDCSDDGSINEIKRCINNDQRFHIIELQEHIGKSFAMNIAIDQIKGDYMFFMNAIDWLDPSVIDYLIYCSHSHPEYRMFSAAKIIHYPHKYDIIYTDYDTSGVLYIKNDIKFRDTPYENIIFNFEHIFAGDMEYNTYVPIYHIDKIENTQKTLTQDEIDKVFNTFTDLLGEYNPDNHVDELKYIYNLIKINNGHSIHNWEGDISM